MTDGENGNELKHEVANLVQQKQALQSMLDRASDEIEDLVETDCHDTNKAQAIEAAKRFRKAASL